jgi:DNA-binding transcriptional LysR family regulator
VELRHLEHIVAIVRFGGFADAARRLRISQPTLSKSIARLEAKIGVLLFHRDGGRARPTAHGQFLANRGASLLKEFEVLGRDFDALVHGEEGRLHIGVGPAPQVGLLPGIISRMSAQFPGLSIQTTQDNAVRIVRDLVDGLYDAAFVYYAVAEPFDDLIRIKVMQRPYKAFARVGHPAVSDHPLAPAELLAYRLASAKLGPVFTDWVGPVCDSQWKNFHGFRSDSYDLIRAQVLDNDFVAVAPSFIFETDVEEGRMVEIPLTWDGIYECWMLVTAERWGSAELRALAEAARAAGAMPRPVGPPPTLRAPPTSRATSAAA